MSSPIHKNLKQLRLDRGLTQEQLAQRVHLTRQAISSYESGRTQPNLDTLKALAEALDADILTLLYGAAQDSLRPWRKGVALATVILVLGLLCAGAALLWAANTFLWIDPAAPFAPERFAARRRLTELNAALIGLALWPALLGGVGTLLLTLPAKPAVPVQRQVKWAALLGLGSYAVTLPWMLLDPHLTGYSPNYMVYPQWICTGAALLLAISLLVTAFRRRRFS